MSVMRRAVQQAASQLEHLPVQGVWRQRFCFAADSAVFAGHFPGHPIMPGVLLLEALAQTGAVALLSLPENNGKIALFGGVNKARFKRQVIPGDVVELKCELTRQEGPLGIGEAIATVGGKICVRAELLFAIS